MAWEMFWGFLLQLLLSIGGLALICVLTVLGACWAMDRIGR